MPLMEPHTKAFRTGCIWKKNRNLNGHFIKNGTRGNIPAGKSHTIGKEGELTPDDKDSCLGTGSFSRPFPRLIKFYSWFLVPLLFFSGRLMRNLLEIRWSESFLNTKCISSHVVTLCHSQGNR